MEKTVEYYLGLPYTIELIPEPAGGWFVGVKELPGCISEGDTAEEAVEMIRDAMRGWIEASLQDGDAIPEPRDADDYSGKFVVRVPRSLHRQLVESAADEGVSLNQYINVALAKAVVHLALKRGKAEVIHSGTKAEFVAFRQHLPVTEWLLDQTVVHDEPVPYSARDEEADNSAAVDQPEDEQG